MVAPVSVRGGHWRHQRDLIRKAESVQDVGARARVAELGGVCESTATFLLENFPLSNLNFYFTSFKHLSKKNSFFRDYSICPRFTDKAKIYF